MQISSGWPLLLACVLVQGAVALAGTRMAIAVASAASALHLLVALRNSDSLPDEAIVLLAFWAAVAAIVIAFRRGHTHVARLTELCDVDETTGCLNRRGFDNYLRRVARQSGNATMDLALLALDLDHFKEINDRFGHLCGDDVLHEVGGSLLEAVGDEGVVARMGGEEFAVVLPRADAESAGVVAERILARLRSLRYTGLPDSVSLTMSAGIAVERLSADHVPAALRARADEALYAAKRSGRDRALLWPPGVHSHSTPPTSTLAHHTRQSGDHYGLGALRRS